MLLSSAGKAPDDPTSPGPDHTPDTPTTSTDPLASSAGTDGSSAVGVTTSATPDCQPEDSAVPGREDRSYVSGPGFHYGRLQ